MHDIAIERTKNPKTKPGPENLGFGKCFTDHMFIMDYTKELGWHDPRIVPYEPLNVDPSTMVFHYGQAVFEGLKAYNTQDGKVLLFRPHSNMKRMNVSNERICIPPIDVDFAVHAIKKLVSIDKDWIPRLKGTSLYIRPFIISTDAELGVKPSSTYKFIVILSPVGSYYKEGINPVKIYVQTEYVRAVRGGVGNAKVPGNYAASLKAQMEAMNKGFSQVLWLDAVERKYIEEVGTMNVFFRIGNEIITPSLEGSILEGITRQSSLQILKSWNVKVSERKISIEELYEEYLKGNLKEAFGTGTAAVISPIGEIEWNNKTMVINNRETGEISSKLYNAITGMQSGNIADEFGWIEYVE